MYFTIYFTSPLFWRACQIKFYSKWPKNVTIFLVLVTHGNTKNAQIIFEKKLKSSRPSGRGFYPWYTTFLMLLGNKLGLCTNIQQYCYYCYTLVTCNIFQLSYLLYNSNHTLFRLYWLDIQLITHPLWASCTLNKVTIKIIQRIRLLVSHPDLYYFWPIITVHTLL